ncbi:45179_t:CDS:2 [Gigaspora margarita]|uniref:45179_t:CDS:1 n=1 Tax=Gigaspora margarita TaxID=4874 RepID=A0ABN7UI43_GIGMA|nr:45179_t:CDS:2 [Gigaspora margarita]
MDITHLISHNSNPLNKQKPPTSLPISPRHETLTYTHLQQKRQSLPHMMTPSQSQVHRGQDHHLPPFLSPPLSHTSQPILQTPITTSMTPSMMHHQQTSSQQTQIQNSIEMQQPIQSQQTTQIHQQQTQSQQQPQSHTPPNRRIAHILSEQKRRENINSGFEELKSIVPSCRGCADSKAIILRKAAHYIQALEAQIQKLKQSNSGSTTPNTSSVTTPPLVSPVMSVKSIPSGHIHMHGGVNGNSMYAINEFNQRIGEEKKLHQQLEQQKFMGQWQTNRLNQNYLNLSYPIPRHHSQYHYHEQQQQHLKTENMDWISGGEKNLHFNNHNYESKIHQQQSYHRNYHPYHSDMNTSHSRASSPHSMGRVMLKHEIHDQTYK